MDPAFERAVGEALGQRVASSRSVAGGDINMAFAASLAGGTRVFVKTHPRAPGALFPAHAHDDDEEAYVLSGDLAFDDLVLNAGDYHLARPGVRHPVGRTRGGCMLLVTAKAA